MDKRDILCTSKATYSIELHKQLSKFHGLFKIINYNRGVKASS